MRDLYLRPQIQKLIDWLFNGTSTQKGQYVPTAEGNRLSRLRMANEIQCI